jgi:hypothetical protein
MDCSIFAWSDSNAPSMLQYYQFHQVLVVIDKLQMKREAK